MVFHLSLSGGKSPQVSRTLLSILAVLNNAVVWIVSTRPPTSKSSRPLLLLLWFTQSFKHQRKLMVFYSRLSDSKSPQVSGILLSILAVLNNAVVWVVSTRPPTSKSSRPFNNPLLTAPKAPITIGIIVTFMFHSVFNSQAGRGTYLSFHILSVLFCGQPDNKVDDFADFLFFCWLL